MVFMATKKISYAKQAAILVTASLLVRFIGFLYRIPLTNIIGDEGNGIYGRGYNIYILFFVISSAGIPPAISKMVSERLALKQYRNAHQVFKISLIISATLGSVSALIMWFGAARISVFINSPETFYAIRTLAPTVLIVAIMSSFRGYFQGMRNTLPTAISQVLEQVFNAIFSVYLAYMFISVTASHGAAGATAGTGIGALFGLLSIIYIYIIVRPSILKKVKKDDDAYGFETDKSIATEILKTSIPIIMGTAIFSITNLIDMKMVTQGLIRSGEFSMQEINILYGQLTGKFIVLTTMPVGIATAIAVTIIPNVASDYKLGKTESLNHKVNMALKYSMLICIPSAVGLFVLSDQILLFLFPSQPDGGLMLKVGAISIIFLALTQILTGVLQGIGFLRVPVIAAVCGVIIKIPINYFLIQIPSVNVKGAVISTTICYIIASSINMYGVKKVTKIKLNNNDLFIKPIVSSIIMGMSAFIIFYGIYFMIESNTIALLISILSSSIIYFSFMVFLGALTEQDIQTLPFINKILKLKKSD
jgi:stage V sporulation protein B